MKYLCICLAILAVFIKDIQALNVTEYTAYIEELIRDEQFLQDYAKWSFELFSQPDYMYGKSLDPFPLHKLRPSDIKCVGALGDSLTAGLGALAKTPMGLVTEYRGVSWSIGGDHTYNRVLSLPNIIRQYNDALEGYSTKTSVIFLKGQNASHNHLNVAESGDVSANMIGQARILLERINSNKYCDLKNDWKIITLFIGGNDLCSFCQLTDPSQYDPENFTKNVNETLKFLYDHFPRTLVNLVLVLDVRQVQQLNRPGICSKFHQQTCPCAAFPTKEQNETLNKWIPQYHQNLLDLVNSGLYNDTDFTVVIQPFMANTTIQLTPKGDIDYGYFAPDCFHFSGKGHSNAALSLWNNMFEPVGQKKSAWHKADTLICPSAEQPYIFTSGNSPKQFESMPLY